MIYLNDYQKEAYTFAAYPAESTYPYLALAEEAGEVCSVLAKAIRQGRGVGSLMGEEKAKIYEELGDVLWQVCAVATDLGFDISDIARDNIGKLTSRRVVGTISTGSTESRV